MTQLSKHGSDPALGRDSSGGRPGEIRLRFKDRLREALERRTEMADEKSYRLQLA